MSRRAWCCPPSSTFEARQAQAEEQARIDAASGAYDQIAIEALTKLPYEQQIDDEIQMLQSSAADRLPAPLAADLEQTGAAGQAQARRVREQDLLDGEREKRRDLSRVLNGEKLRQGRGRLERHRPRGTHEQRVLGEPSCAARCCGPG